MLQHTDRYRGLELGGDQHTAEGMDRRVCLENFSYRYWRGARAAESGSLLRSCAGDRTVGSNPTLSVYVPLAQLDRALGCGPKGQRFKSSRA